MLGLTHRDTDNFCKKYCLDSGAQTMGLGSGIGSYFCRGFSGIIQTTGTSDVFGNYLRWTRYLRVYVQLSRYDSSSNQRCSFTHISIKITKELTGSQTHTMKLT